YKPLVFLLTDGQPTDDWESAARMLRAANNPRIANIYAIGCGPDVDVEALRQVTDIVLLLSDLSAQGFKKFFVWLSASVQTASVRLETNPNQPIDMPALPDSLQVAARTSQRLEGDAPRQLFLQVRCQKSGRPYLMRYARSPNGRHYQAIASHPLEVLEEDANDFLPPIQSELLDGVPPCPYCENQVAGKCPCGTLFCNAEHPEGPVICPSCRMELTSGGPGSFEVRRSQG
ncbi:MAG: TerY-C metal binding domain-containing protein, partial [Planctomycetota bacterium]